MRKTIALLLGFLALAGCSRGTGGGEPVTEFSLFVRDQLDATANDIDPVQVNAIDFADLDTDDDFSDILR